MSNDEFVKFAASLDSNECLAGYLAGFDGWPPNQGASVSWMHGWNNAQVDRGRAKATPFQRRFVEWAVGNGWLQRGRAHLDQKREAE